MNLSTQDIYNTLNVQHPVSIIRAGDGEGLVLRSNADIQTYQDCVKRVMIRQMGYEPTMTEVSQVRDNLIKAYQGADIVGIPMHYNLDKLNDDWRSVAKVVSPYCISDKRCSTDVAYELLYTGLLKDWLTNKKVVNYISCRNIDEQLKNAFGIRQVNSYIIAPEAKFTSGYEGKRHYPDQFNELEWWMDAAPCLGNPCLVGAGVIGKLYCNWFRDRGGIAIDLGAVFDLWAGYSTRGPNRGLDEINEEYKL